MGATKKVSDQDQRDKAVMNAMVQHEYGPLLEVVRSAEVPKPRPADDQILVRVHASSVNAMEWHLMSGVPLLFRPMFGLRRPKHRIFGADVAGTVEAVGKDVTKFRVDDEVFGEIGVGAYAEYALASEKHLTHKPIDVSFETAAAVGVAGLTALQFLRDVADVQPGQKVLINGASGGVGTYAVQIAKVLGAEVTAVCSTRNVEQARELGADHVVDYTRSDALATDERYDVILDIAGTRSLSATKKVMAPTGIYLMVGGAKNRWVGPIPRVLWGFVSFVFGSKRQGVYTAVSKAEDLAYLGELLESGAIRSVIQDRFPLSEVATPLDRQGSFHATGKTVITVVAEQGEAG